MVVGLLLAVAIMATPAFALSVPGFTHHQTGNITTVDRDGKTFTLTGDKDGKQYTFDVKDRALLAGIRQGEHVKVGYKKQGGSMVASSIVPQTPKRTAFRR
jgi:Cu/Ag efflux protein CusF